MPSIVDLSLSAVTFPPGCIRCGAATNGIFPLAKWKGIDLILLRFGRRYTFDVPVCGNCIGFLQLARIGSLVAVVLLTITAITVLVLSFEYLKSTVGEGTANLLFWVFLFGPGLFIRHVLESRLNVLYLGLTCKRIDTANGRVAFWVRKDEFARKLLACNQHPPMPQNQPQ